MLACGERKERGVVTGLLTHRVFLTVIIEIRELEKDDPRLLLAKTVVSVRHGVRGRLDVRNREGTRWPHCGALGGWWGTTPNAAMEQQPSLLAEVNQVRGCGGCGWA